MKIEKLTEEEVVERMEREGYDQNNPDFWVDVSQYYRQCQQCDFWVSVDDQSEYCCDDCSQ